MAGSTPSANARISRASRLASSTPTAASRAAAAATAAPQVAEQLIMGARRSFHLGQSRRLVVGQEGIDELIERLAAQHLVDLVEGQIDPVVGDAALREVVGADALGAVARSHLAPAR